MTVKKDENKNTSSFFLYFSTITVNLMAFSSGCAFAWSSASIPKLDGTSDSYPNPLIKDATLLESSWIVSLLSLGASCGPILAGALSGRIGRKLTILLCCVPMIISHIIIVFGNQVEHFYISRFLLGIGVGSVYTTVPMYVGEIAEVHNRGLLGCIFSLSSVTGNLFVFLVGPFVSIQQLSSIIMIPLVMFLIVFGVFVPESPYYLVSISKDEEALQSLIKMRTKSADVVAEMSHIKKYIEKTQLEKLGLRDMISSKPLKKSLIISLGLVLAQQCSGVTSIHSYLQPIFNASGGSIPPHYAAIIVGTIQLCTVALTTQLIDRLGRKILLQISTIGAIIALSSLGTYFYLQDNNYDVSLISWLPIVSITIFLFSYCLGMGPVTWAMVGELFPSNVKSLASTITVSVCLGIAFLAAFAFPTISIHLTMAGTFWTFGVFCVFSLMFMIFVLPETKGKTFEEIQELINGQKCKHNDKKQMEC